LTNPLKPDHLVYEVVVKRFKGLFILLKRFIKKIIADGCIGEDIISFYRDAYQDSVIAEYITTCYGAIQ
jgi:hypothetical protein